MFIRGTRIPNYVFKSAQEEKSILQEVIERLWYATKSEISDKIGDERGVTTYASAVSEIHISDVEKDRLVKAFDMDEEIVTDTEIGIFLQEYLLYEDIDYSDMWRVVGEKKDFFNTLAEQQVEDYTGGELLQLDHKEVSVKDNTIYLSFDYTTYMSNSAMKEQWDGGY